MAKPRRLDSAPLPERSKRQPASCRKRFNSGVKLSPISAQTGTRWKTCAPAIRTALQSLPGSRWHRAVPAPWFPASSTRLPVFPLRWRGRVRHPKSLVRRAGQTPVSRRRDQAQNAMSIARRGDADNLRILMELSSTASSLTMSVTSSPHIHAKYQGEEAVFSMLSRKRCFSAAAGLGYWRLRGGTCQSLAAIRRRPEVRVARSVMAWAFMHFCARPSKPAFNRARTLSRLFYPT